MKNLIYLAKYDSHIQKCLFYLVNNLDDKEKDNVNEYIFNDIFYTRFYSLDKIKSSQDSNEDNFIIELMQDKDYLLSDNFCVFFENLFIERNLYLRYFAYCEVNIVNFLNYIIKTYEKIEFIDETINKNSNRINEIKQYFTDLISKDDEKYESNFSKINIIFENLEFLKYKNSCDMRNLLKNFKKFIQNMIIDIGLSSGIEKSTLEDEEILTSASENFKKETKQEDIKLNKEKLKNLNDNNNFSIFERCQTFSKKDKHEIINIPKPYAKPKEFILKEENPEEEISDEEDSDDEIFDNKNKVYKIQPIEYTSETPYKSIKIVFELLIKSIVSNINKEDYDGFVNSFNDDNLQQVKITKNVSFGLNNLYRLEVINNIIELFSDLNYTIEVTNIIEENKNNENNIEDKSNIEANDTNFTFLENENKENKSKKLSKTNLIVRKNTRKKTLNNNQSILTFTRSEKNKNKLLFFHHVDYLLKDDTVIVNFFNVISYFFFACKNNSILHKEIECLVYFSLSKYCPKEISYALINQCILFNLIFENIDKLNLLDQPNLANFCEILTLVFLLENKESEEYLKKNEKLRISYKEFYSPIYEMIKDSLLSDSICKNEDKDKEYKKLKENTQEDEFETQMQIMRKKNLKGFIEDCNSAMNRKKKNNLFRSGLFLEDSSYNLLKLRTQNFHRKSAVISDKCNNLQFNSKSLSSSISVDEIENNKVIDLNLESTELSTSIIEENNDELNKNENDIIPHKNSNNSNNSIDNQLSDNLFGFEIIKYKEVEVFSNLLENNTSNELKEVSKNEILKPLFMIKDHFKIQDRKKSVEVIQSPDNLGICIDEDFMNNISKSFSSRK